LSVRPSLTHSTEWVVVRPLDGVFGALAVQTSCIFAPRTTLCVPVTCTVTNGRPTTAIASHNVRCSG